MTTATAAQCQKCEASAPHLITESDQHGEYTKCLQCGEVQADKVVGDWPDEMPNIGWGWRAENKKQPLFITMTLCVPGLQRRKDSDVAFLEIEYNPYQISGRANPQAIILSVKGWPYHWSAGMRGKYLPRAIRTFRAKTGYVAKNFGEALQLSLADKTLI